MAALPPGPLRRQFARTRGRAPRAPAARRRPGRPMVGGCTSVPMPAAPFTSGGRRFPMALPEQITAGPAEEEGIAIAPDGRSLITSVGTGISTIWIRDRRGERPLSEQGHSFLPTFSRDGRTVYYLASQRPGAFQATRGELWSVNVDKRRAAASRAIGRDRQVRGGCRSERGVLRDGRRQAECDALAGSPRRPLCTSKDGR